MKKIESYEFKDFVSNTLMTTKGYSELSDIQKEVLPFALKGKNVIAKSSTGSGKTDAFLIPIMQNLYLDSDNVECIIVAPTRELASQIYANAMDYASNDEKIRIKLLMGGFDRKRDLGKKTSNPHIIIGTPARLKDLLLDNGLYDISKVKTIVLDEIDMIFEMKFLEDIDAIMSKLKKDVQTMAFSATINDQLKGFIKKYMESNVLIDLSKKELTADEVKHYAIPLKGRNRKDALLTLCESINPYLCLIFSSKKENVNEYFKVLRENGYNVGLIHGDLDSRSRRQAMKKITSFDYQFVVASDIASRGIDIEGVSHVISIDFPHNLEFYFHRAGRCGRNGASGECYSFYDEKDEKTIKQLISKGLKIENVEFKNGEMKSLKPFIKENKGKKIDPELAKEIHKVKVKNKNTRVKPGYKKKMQQEIDKLKRKHKRQIIKKSIEEQRKKSYKPGGKNYHE
jgi:ATP-dependent RNA helicase CshB